MLIEVVLSWWSERVLQVGGWPMKYEILNKACTVSRVHLITVFFA